MKLFHRSLAATATSAGTAALMLAGAAQAQSQSLLPELRTTFQLQGFLPRTTSTARVDDWYLGTPGTTASGEDDYGLPRSKPAFGLAFMKRIGESWRIDLEYLEQRRTANSVPLRRAIDAYGGTYVPGTPVSARMALTSLRIAGGYTLLRRDTTEFGLSFGGIVSSYDLTVNGPGTLRFEENISNAQASLGLYATTAISSTLRLHGRFEAGPQNRQLSAGGHWRFAANASLGANLRWTNLRISQNRGAYLVNANTAEFKLLGPQAYLEVGF
jgi:hypothetical protein